MSSDPIRLPYPVLKTPGYGYAKLVFSEVILVAFRFFCNFMVSLDSILFIMYRYTITETNPLSLPSILGDSFRLISKAPESLDFTLLDLTARVSRCYAKLLSDDIDHV